MIFDFSILERLLRGNENIGISPLGFGADLWYFDSQTRKAKLQSVNGVGIKTNYSIKTMFLLKMFSSVVWQIQ